MVGIVLKDSMYVMVCIELVRIVGRYNCGWVICWCKINIVVLRILWDFIIKVINECDKF